MFTEREEAIHCISTIGVLIHYLSETDTNMTKKDLSRFYANAVSHARKYKFPSLTNEEVFDVLFDCSEAHTDYMEFMLNTVESKKK